MTSMPPGLIRSDEQVASIRDAKAQAAADRAKAEAAPQMAAMARDLSQTSLEGDSALKRMIENAQPGGQVPVA
jgi:predicted 2-oxoglutarate/Fe(II)-dependent dioxygenase YbiX